MRKFKLLGLAFAAFLSFGSLTANAQSLSPNTKWHWNKGKIVIETPGSGFAKDEDRTHRSRWSWHAWSWCSREL